MSTSVPTARPVIGLDETSRQLLAEARRIADRLEIQHTPRHGRWLNMAEIELRVLHRQCRDRRLEHAVAAWVTARNATESAIAWRFTTVDARIKRKRRYPVIDA